MNFKKLPDTPWHIGYVTKNEDDPRRHKARCVYNDGDKCNNPNMLKCISSSHCKYYAEDWDTAERFKASMRIDYKGAGVIPTSIGELLYGKTNKKQNKAQPNKKIVKIREYEICPYCKRTVRKKQLQKHIDQKCDKKQNELQLEINQKPKEYLCLSCKYFDKKNCSCSVIKSSKGDIFHCLFYKL